MGYQTTLTRCNAWRADALHFECSLHPALSTRFTASTQDDDQDGVPDVSDPDDQFDKDDDADRQHEQEVLVGPRAGA